MKRRVRAARIPVRTGDDHIFTSIGGPQKGRLRVHRHRALRFREPLARVGHERILVGPLQLQEGPVGSAPRGSGSASRARPCQYRRPGRRAVGREALDEEVGGLSPPPQRRPPARPRPGRGAGLQVGPAEPEPHQPRVAAAAARRAALHRLLSALRAGADAAEELAGTAAPPPAACRTRRRPRPPASPGRRRPAPGRPGSGRVDRRAARPARPPRRRAPACPGAAGRRRAYHLRAALSRPSPPGRPRSPSPAARASASRPSVAARSASPSTASRGLRRAPARSLARRRRRRRSSRRRAAPARAPRGRPRTRVDLQGRCCSRMAASNSPAYMAK